MVPGSVVAVARYLPRGNKTEPIVPAKRPAPLDEALALLGHDVYYGDVPVPVGAPRRAGIYHCRLCDVTWLHSRRRAIVNDGPCRKSSIWAQAIPSSLTMPWLMPRDQEVPLRWRGHAVHMTHALQWYRGCLFCRACGARSAYAWSPVLGAPCLMRPNSPSTRKRLISMKRGKWPDAGQTWPNPEGSQCPNDVRPFLEEEL